MLSAIWSGSGSGYEYKTSAGNLGPRSPYCLAPFPVDKSGVIESTPASRDCFALLNVRISAETSEMLMSGGSPTIQKCSYMRSDAAKIPESLFVKLDDWDVD